MKGKMLARTTPHPEPAADGPNGSPHLNGSIKVANTATGLLNGPPEKDADDTAHAIPVGVAAEVVDASETTIRSAGRVEEPAVQKAVSRNETEIKESDATASRVEQDEREQQSRATGQSNPNHKFESGSLRSSTVAGMRALLDRDGLRSTVLGLALTGIALALGTGSVLSGALLVVGVVMLIVGLLGPRLQGRFAVEFGPSGASIEIQTHMASVGSRRLAAPLAPWKPVSAPTALSAADAQSARDSAAAAKMLAELTDARDEAIELNVKRLEALLAGPQSG